MDSLTAQPDVLPIFSNQLAEAVERIGPALVTVAGRPRQPGSGLVYGPDLVLTAAHVLERESDLTVGTHDGRTLPAHLVGRDPASDLALLRVPDLSLPVAAVAANPARVGQLILAVGRPGDSGLMASIGIISALGGPLQTEQGGLLAQYIRTDATPYPGFSGGPLVDATGAVVGLITTGIAAGITLAVPAAHAWHLAAILAAHGQVARGYLGLSTQSVELAPDAPTSRAARQDWGRSGRRGLRVAQVEPNGPAAQGGLLAGDILVAFDGQPTTHTIDLLALLAGGRAGQTVPVEVVRDGALHTQQVAVGQRGNPPPATKADR